MVFSMMRDRVFGRGRMSGMGSKESNHPPNWFGKSHVYRYDNGRLSHPPNCKSSHPKTIPVGRFRIQKRKVLSTKTNLMEGVGSYKQTNKQTNLLQVLPGHIWRCPNVLSVLIHRTLPESLAILLEHHVTQDGSYF